MTYCGLVHTLDWGLDHSLCHDLGQGLDQGLGLVLDQGLDRDSGAKFPVPTAPHHTTVHWSDKTFLHTR